MGFSNPNNAIDPATQRLVSPPGFRNENHTRLETARLLRRHCPVIIPKGFRTTAQGCRAAATLGFKHRITRTPKGFRNGDGTLRNPFRVNLIVGAAPG